MNESKIAIMCDGDAALVRKINMGEDIPRVNISLRALIDWYIADLYIEQSLIIDKVIYMLALIV